MRDDVKTYTDHDYRYPTMVRHNGVVIAFAMDEHRRIRYTVLDLAATTASDPLDSAGGQRQPDGRDVLRRDRPRRVRGRRSDDPAPGQVGHLGAGRRGGHGARGREGRVPVVDGAGRLRRCRSRSCPTGASCTCCARPSPIRIRRRWTPPTRPSPIRTLPRRTSPRPATSSRTTTRWCTCSTTPGGPCSTSADGRCRWWPARCSSTASCSSATSCSPSWRCGSSAAAARPGRSRARTASAQPTSRADRSLSPRRSCASCRR